MKVNRKQLQAAAFIIVYLFALYLWTLPFQDDRRPYGEFDAISHWELGDFIAQRDRTFLYLPDFLDFSYATDNKFKPHTLWYPPPFHTDFAVISSFSNDRMVPIFLTNAIFASSILISVFFVMNRLFGFLPGILSSFLLTFSLRDIMPYLWGQWPERFAYAFIPVILYCFYTYYSDYPKEKKPVYLYIMSLLLAVNAFMHPLVFFHSLVGLLVLWVVLSIKDRKVHLNPKHVRISIILFLLMFSIFPYQSGNVIVSFFGASNPDDSKYSPLTRLFQWSPSPEDFIGSVPASYFSFKEMHGLWTLPFLLLGLLALVIRRENRDIFLLAWLISLYLVLHRDLIGKFTFLHRSLSATAHIFVPITIIGALSIVSFIRLPKNHKMFLKYGMAALVVLLAFIYNFPQAHSSLDNAYDNPLVRINQAQIDVSEWLKENTDENQNVSIIGPPQEIMQKVWWMASYSHRTSHYFEGFLLWKTYEENREYTIRQHMLNDYIVFDYSDIALLNDRSFVDKWLEFEKNNLGNHTLVYNKDNIRVYKYEAS